VKRVSRCSPRYGLSFQPNNPRAAATCQSTYITPHPFSKGLTLRPVHVARGSSYAPFGPLYTAVRMYRPNCGRQLVYNILFAHYGRARMSELIFPIFDVIVEWRTTELNHTAVHVFSREAWTIQNGNQRKMMQSFVISIG